MRPFDLPPLDLSRKIEGPLLAGYQRHKSGLQKGPLKNYQEQIKT